MEARHVKRIEQSIDVVAAAAFGGAAGFAALRLGAVVAGAVGAVAFAALLRLLQLTGVSAPSFALPVFDLLPLPADAQSDELLLTEADRVQSPDTREDELVLEDVLAQLSEDSRVVRLFDVTSMPTPAELKARIDGHLDRGSASAADASKALHEALFELRKSLR